MWKFEGSDTLFKLMSDKDFPYNVEPYLFKSGVAIDGEPKGSKRKAKIISTIFGQILENLSAAHATGIILRDVKPENIIFDPIKGKFKLIDLGAAAGSPLRVQLPAQGVHPGSAVQRPGGVHHVHADPGAAPHAGGARPLPGALAAQPPG